MLCPSQITISIWVNPWKPGVATCVLIDDKHVPKRGGTIFMISGLNMCFEHYIEEGESELPQGHVIRPAT